MDTSHIPCNFFNTPSGCKHGNSCAFSHSNQQGQQGGGYKGKTNKNQFQGSQNKPQFKKQQEDTNEESHWEIPINCPIQGIGTSQKDKSWYWNQESAHVLNDLDPGPEWLFSCYAQEDGGENVAYEGAVVFSDFCPEELAWETIHAAQTNALDQFESQFNNIKSEYQNKKESIIQNCKDQLTQCYPLRGTGQNRAIKNQHHENRFSGNNNNNNNNNNNFNSNYKGNNPNPNYKGNNPNPNYKGNNPNPNYKGNNPNPNYKGNNPNPNFKGNNYNQNYHNNNNNDNDNNNNYNNNNTNSYKGKGGSKYNYKSKSNNNSMGDSSCPW